MAPQPPRLVSDDLKTEIEQTMQQTCTALETPFTELLTGMHTLTTWSATIETHLHTQMNALQEHMSLWHGEFPCRKTQHPVEMDLHRSHCRAASTDQGLRGN